jgi:hypothetical protein
MLLLAGVTVGLGAQADVRRTQVLFGLRLGVTAVVQAQADFNSAMQPIFPAAGQQYYPVFTEMGLEAVELVPLGESASSFAVHEVFSLGGLDQGMAIPGLSLVFGFHGRGGLELGLGPYITLEAPGGAVRLAAAVVYEVSYAIPMKGFVLPITLTMVPLPSYANPKLSITTGFRFASLE